MLKLYNPDMLAKASSYATVEAIKSGNIVYFPLPPI